MRRQRRVGERGTARKSAGHSAQEHAHARCDTASWGGHDTALGLHDTATRERPGHGLCVLAGLCVHTVHLTSFSHRTVSESLIGHCS